MEKKFKDEINTINNHKNVLNSKLASFETDFATFVRFSLNYMVEIEKSTD